MKSPICTILLSKSEFSFALLLVTFEPFDLEQSYIPHLKALMCGINAAEAQRCDCMFTFCYAYPKMGVLLHKMANASHSSSGTVTPLVWTQVRFFSQCTKSVMLLVHTVLVLEHYSKDFFHALWQETEIEIKHFKANNDKIMNELVSGIELWPPA